MSTGWVGHFSDGSSGVSAFYIGTPYGAVAGAYAPSVARMATSGYTTSDATYGVLEPSQSVR